MFTSQWVWRGGSERVRGVPMKCLHPVHRMWEVTNFDSKEVPFILLCCVMENETRKAEKKLYGGGKRLRGRVRVEVSVGSGGGGGGEFRGDRGRGNIGSEGTCACPHTKMQWQSFSNTRSVFCSYKVCTCVYYVACNPITSQHVGYYTHTPVYVCMMYVKPTQLLLPHFYPLQTTVLFT